MISYAQNFEDVMLSRCFAGRQDGFYIDVGAMDPVNDSVTKIFYDAGWSGINIEPNEFFYRKLVVERPRDINLNFAIGEQEGQQLLYQFTDYGNSTFEKEYRDRFAELGYEPVEKSVRITTLAAICRAFANREIDFLKIDCEGWEHLVIRGADWEHFRPALVIVEATEPLTTTPSWSDWEPLLTEQNRYQMVYFDGLNRFYLRSDRQELRPHFEVPPNVFDKFLPNAMHEALQAKATLTQENDTLTAQAANLKAQSGRDQEQIRALQAECSDLKRSLLNTKLWVGCLSQEVAACHLRENAANGARERA